MEYIHWVYKDCDVKKKIVNRISQLNWLLRDKGPTTNDALGYLMRVDMYDKRSLTPIPSTEWLQSAYEGLIMSCCYLVQKFYASGDKKYKRRIDELFAPVYKLAKHILKEIVFRKFDDAEEFCADVRNQVTADMVALQTMSDMLGCHKPRKPAGRDERWILYDNPDAYKNYRWAK